MRYFVEINNRGQKIGMVVKDQKTAMALIVNLLDNVEGFVTTNYNVKDDEINQPKVSIEPLHELRETDKTEIQKDDSQDESF